MVITLASKVWNDVFGSLFSEFFQNKLVETIQFMEVLTLKDSVEKDSFFRKLPNIAEQLPREIVLKKLLPKSQVEPLIPPVHDYSFYLLFFSQSAGWLYMLIVWTILRSYSLYWLLLSSLVQLLLPR